MRLAQSPLIGLVTGIVTGLLALNRTQAMKRKSGNHDWRRPAGIPAGNWQYINDRSIAIGYDEALLNSPLVSLDQQIIQRHLPKITRGIVADFGCGTGRNLLPILDKGWRAIGVDLSFSMLEQFATKLSPDHQAVLVQSNLLDLNGIASNVADFGQCLFSTLGMLQGKLNRRNFFEHVARILKSEAPFVVHVHNYWHHLQLRGGIKWMLANWIAARRGRCELGDRYADYRSVNQMMLHHFSLRSICQELSQTGFQVETTYAILSNGTFTNQTAKGSLGRAVGWVLVCRRG